MSGDTLRRSDKCESRERVAQIKAAKRRRTSGSLELGHALRKIGFGASAAPQIASGFDAQTMMFPNAIARAYWASIAPGAHAANRSIGHHRQLWRERP
jgi:hypothetical protein